MFKSVFALFPLCSCYALFNGNPETVSLIDEGLLFSKDSVFSFDLGYQKDWVFDYQLDAQNLADSSFIRSNSVTDQGFVAMNFWDHYQVYGTLGSAEFAFDQTLRSDEAVSYLSKETFTFGVGGKILIYQGHQLSLGVDGKYQFSHPNLGTIIKEGVYIPQTKVANATVYAWQISLALAYHIDIFSPYIGLTYLNQNVHFKNLKSGVVSSLDRDFYAKNRNPVGGFLGVSLSSGRDFSLTVESRFITENAFTLFLDFRF